MKYTKDLLNRFTNEINNAVEMKKDNGCNTYYQLKEIKDGAYDTKEDCHLSYGEDPITDLDGLRNWLLGEESILRNDYDEIEKADEFVRIANEIAVVIANA